MHMGDHPRSRGVYPRSGPDPCALPGSSPLARGLLAGGGDDHPPMWIIPARAGFTGGGLRTCGTDRDHPRSRGVYLAPRLRMHYGLRIIPARAGFTYDDALTALDAQDHPRSRGVYRMRPHTAPWRGGSSPLARGLPECVRVSSRDGGIIPARAGFTPGARGGRRADRDHPRSRGVYVTPTMPSSTQTGSSPLARGLLRLAPLRPVIGGIIPARAGFTRAASRWATSSWDHPRSRGVYCSTCVRSRVVAGSSPLARGLLEDLQGPGRRDRIIPARAGFTPPGAHR